MCLKIKLNNNKKKCSTIWGLPSGVKGMLCDTLFFLFFLVLTFHFFPNGTKKGGSNLCHFLHSLCICILPWSNGLLVIDLQKVFYASWG